MHGNNLLYCILLFRYEVLKCGDVEKLVKRRPLPDDSPCYYATIEDTFDIIKKAHIATGHGGRDRMMKELAPRYANITVWALERFKAYCMECQQKRKRPVTTGAVVRPIMSTEFNSRGQVDLIDMQSMPAKSFRWIMVYQDHLTKFCMLRALTSKRASEVAYQLVDIFLTLGAPAILQSDNGAEFTAQVISEVTQLWPDLKLVRGKPRHPQSQGSVERANGDIKDMLTAWLQDNSTVDWSFGIKFVQFSKNSAYCAVIKRSPYEALFGSRTKVGLTSTSLPPEVIERLQSEEDLLAAFSSDAESVSPDDEQESMVDDVMSTPLQLSIEETPPSPPLLTPIQPVFHSEKLSTSSQCVGDKDSRSVVVLQCNVKVTDVHVTRQKCCVTADVMAV